MNIRHIIGWAIISVFVIAAIVSMIVVFFTEFNREERIEFLVSFVILLALTAGMVFGVSLIVT